MLPLTLLALALSSSHTAAPRTPNEVALRLAPSPRNSHEAEIRLEQTTDGGELVVVMNGGRVPAAFLPELDVELVTVRTLGFSQTWEQFEPGGARSWLRQYREATWTVDGDMTVTQMGQDQVTPMQVNETAPAEGVTFQFWTTDGDDPSQRIVDDPNSAGDSAEFDDLLADLSLESLLPLSDVATGEEWSVDGADLRQLWEPGGNLGWDPSLESLAHSMLEFTTRTYGGDLTLALTEVKTVGDSEMATCSVAGELSRTTVAPGDLSQVPVVDGTATDTIVETIQVEGELRWDLTRGAAESLTLDGRTVSTTRTDRDPDQEGPSYYSVFTLEGEYRFELSAVALPDGELQVQ